MLNIISCLLVCILAFACLPKLGQVTLKTTQPSWLRQQTPQNQCQDELLSWRPSASLQEIFAYTNITTPNSLNKVVEATQKSWLRPSGLERWEIHDSVIPNQEKIRPLLDDIGLIQERMPSKTHYHYAVVLGGTLTRVEERIQFLRELWEKGIRFDKVVFLASKRPIFTDIEVFPKSLAPKNSPKTESEIMQWVWNHQPIPKALKKLPLQIIDTDMKKNTEGKLIRPTTGDTVIAWLATKPSKGSILAISNQPFIDYQHAVLQTYLKDWYIETAGAKAEKNVSVPVVLDTLARYLYQHLQRLTHCK